MLHQVGVSFDLHYDARKHKIKTLNITLHVTGIPKVTRTLKRNLHDCPVMLTPSICRVIKPVC